MQNRRARRGCMKGRQGVELRKGLYDRRADTVVLDEAERILITVSRLV